MTAPSPTARRDGRPDESAARRTVAALSVSVFAEWLGASAVLPLLPLYLRHHGSSDALVGATMSAFFVGAFVVQYPAGRLSDRIGRRPIQVAGLIVYAVASLAFGLFAGPVTALFLRAAQGVGSGVVDVASAAIVGEAAPAEWRGRAFGLFYGSRTAGLAIGPLFGSLAGVSSVNLVFIGAFVCAIVATVPILVLVRRGRPAAAGIASEGGATRRPLWRRRAILGVVTVAVAGGLIGGMYEVCWSLLLNHKGAHSWQIGLSWTLFAAPFVAMSVPAGWLVDHFDARYLAAASMAGSAAFACTYPFLPHVDLMIGLGALEATAVALGYPAMLSQLNRLVDPAELGRGQGLVSASQTAATGVAAFFAGALFAIGPFVPFVTVGSTVALLIVVLAICWRGVDGRGEAGRRPSAGLQAPVPDHATVPTTAAS